MKIELVLISDKKSRNRVFGLRPLTLPYLAALTPPDIEVKITSTNYEDIDLETDADLIGISVTTFKALESYALAQEFRKRGKTVVLGGPHPTIMPEEALNYADSVVRGEAEIVWPKLLEDFKKNKLKALYENEAAPQLRNLPHPRWDLWPQKNRLNIDMFQVTRGCPYLCDFCYHSAYASSFRWRPVEEVVREIASMESSYIYFADDNLTGNNRYAKQLFSELSGLKKKWISNLSLEVATDNELLSLLYKSGCRLVTIGLESIDQENLNAINKKRIPMNKYQEYVKIFHDHGIMVSGFFIFGFDNDDHSVFERTLDFIDQIKLDSVRSYILSPIPKTVLYQRLKKENRLIPYVWDGNNPYGLPRYAFGDGNNVTFIPKKITVERLQDGFNWFQKESFSLSSILKRSSHSALYSNFLISFGVNITFRQNLKKLKSRRSDHDFSMSTNT
jgi:radical SAM superfamily enzyme YgiQ (UPF0313 family)